MTSSVCVRRFNPGEELALFKIYFSAIHLVASLDYSAEQVHAWAPKKLDADLWSTRMHGINPFVAEIQNEVVGYADVQENGYIDHFFVSGCHQRHGIGRSLMEIIHAEANRLQITELTSDVSKTAQPFFARFGFEVSEQRFPIVRGVLVPNALMRKFI
jgi:putative acetyltransferase